MKYTKKQRREIYLDAAERLLNHENDCICVSLWECSGKTWYCFTHTAINLFDEFSLFDPETSKCFWFGSIFKPECKDSDRDDRINCLLLCAEMCKN